MERQDLDAETARGLREYHARHGRASDAVAMPRAVLEMVAKIEPVDEHDDNGPGRVVCPACGDWMSMRWSAGKRVDDVANMAHNVHCPAVWARNAFTGGDARKPCTCDGAGRGPGRACVVKAGGRLGDLWRCADDLTLTRTNS